MKRFAAILALVFMSAWIQPTYASIISLSPVADGVITTNALGFWKSNTTDTTLHLSRSGSIVEYGILEFDFSQIPDWTILTGATLHLTTASIITNVGNNDATLSVYGFTGDGVVANGDQNATATLLTSETYQTGATNSPPRNTQLSLSFDTIAPLVSAALADDFFTIRLYVPSYVTMPVYSSEALYADYRPYLSLNYEPQQDGGVPEPNGLVLVAVGLLTLVASRMRLQK